MSVSEYALWASVLVSVAALTVAIWSPRAKATSARFRAIYDKLDDKAEAAVVAAVAGKIDLVEDRITRVETDMKHLPDKDVAHKLELGLSDLNGRMATLTAQLAPVTAMANRIQDAMIEKVTTT